MVAAIEYEFLVSCTSLTVLELSALAQVTSIGGFVLSSNCTSRDRDGSVEARQRHLRIVTSSSIVAHFSFSAKKLKCPALQFRRCGFEARSDNF
jgi:hypothetical protein